MQNESQENRNTMNSEVFENMDILQFYQMVEQKFTL